MAVQLFNQLIELTFSHWKRPASTAHVIDNVLKFSIWGALGTGCAAGVSALFSRNMVEKNALADYIFKASLTSCATFTVFPAYIIYRCLQISNEYNPEVTITFNQKVNTDIARLEIGAITACAAIASARKTLADYSILPLFWIGVTMAATRLFHSYQNKQIGNP